MSGSASKFLNTSGRGTLGIGVCSRCRAQRSLGGFTADPPPPGLPVCKDQSEGCIDKYDPYRLPPRQPDKMTLQHPRPDERMDPPATPYVPTPRAEDLEDFLRDG